MQIASNAVERLINATRRFERLHQKFSEFIEQLDVFAEPSCPLRGIITTKASDKSYCTASFATITIGFRFTPAFLPDGTAAGRVTCSLEAPKFFEQTPILGIFMFNTQGITDFDVPAGFDKIEINYQCVQIVAHFINIALERAPFLNTLPN